jgi:hypothetical protein
VNGTISALLVIFIAAHLGLAEETSFRSVKVTDSKGNQNEAVLTFKRRAQGAGNTSGDKRRRGDHRLQPDRQMLVRVHEEAPHYAGRAYWGLVARGWALLCF